MHDPLHRRAFTLVEVMVTTGIVGVLAALLMGGLNSAMAASRSSLCANHLRQLALATESYATTFQDSYPAAVLYFQSGGGVRSVAWDDAAGGGATRGGPLAPYLDLPMESLSCPQLPPASGAAPPGTGYQYNTTFIGHEGSLPAVDEDGRVHDGWSQARLGLGPSQRRRTDAVALFADAGYRGGSNKFMRAPGNTVELDAAMIHAGTSAFRHRGCCNACCLDGHGATFGEPRPSPVSTADLLKFVTDFPRNGFLTGDDSAYDPR